MPSAKLFLFLVVCATVFGLPWRGFAQGLEYFDAGTKAFDRGDLDIAIDRYTAALQAGDLSAHNVSMVYNNRGLAHGAKTDYDRALADYNEAIRANPKNGEAYNNRGNTYVDKHDYTRAVQDYSEAIRLSPKDDLAYANRGRARFYQGQYQPAQEDFLKAVEANATYPYNAIWLYLARAFGGRDGRAELEKNAGKLKYIGVTEKFVALFLGRAAPNEVLETVKSDPQPQNLCEAEFYLGEYFLLRRRKEDATKLFKAAAERCPPDFFEYSGARVELERLGK